MSLAKLKKEIQSFQKKELEALILDIYGKNKLIKEYLDFFLQPNEEALIEKYKSKLTDYLRRYKKPRIGKAKTLIREFSKTYQLPELEAELMYTYIIECYDILQYSYGTTVIENSVYSMRNTFIAFILKHDLEASFQSRIENNRSIFTVSN